MCGRTAIPQRHAPERDSHRGDDRPRRRRPRRRGPHAISLPGGGLGPPRRARRRRCLGPRDDAAGDPRPGACETGRGARPNRSLRGPRSAPGRNGYRQGSARPSHSLAVPKGTGPFVAVNCGALPASLVEAQRFGHVRRAFSGADDHAPGLFRSRATASVPRDFLRSIGGRCVWSALDEHQTRG